MKDAGAALVTLPASQLTGVGIRLQAMAGVVHDMMVGGSGYGSSKGLSYIFSGNGAGDGSSSALDARDGTPPLSSSRSGGGGGGGGIVQEFNINASPTSASRKGKERMVYGDRCVRR